MNIYNINKNENRKIKLEFFVRDHSYSAVVKPNISYNISYHFFSHVRVRIRKLEVLVFRNIL